VSLWFKFNVTGIEMKSAGLYPALFVYAVSVVLFNGGSLLPSPRCVTSTQSEAASS
jgi:hypothetical protein